MVKLIQHDKSGYSQTFAIMNGTHEITRIRASNRKEALTKFIDTIEYYITVRNVTPAGHIIY